MSQTSFYTTIEPLFTYEYIGRCFDTGVTMRTQKIWNQHILNKLNIKKGAKNSLFINVLRGIDRIAPSDEYNKIFRYFLFKANKIDYGIPHLIPPNLIDLFPIQKNMHKYNTVYDVLLENNFKFVIKEPHIRAFDPFIIKNVPKLLHNNDFIFIKFNALDGIGHKYGPHSIEIQRKIKYYDNLLNTLNGALEDKAIIIIMSDHGMVPVKYNFNLMQFLSKNNMIYGKHYISFLGATYASFWFKNMKYEIEIKDMLSKLNIGKFLDLHEKKALGIDWIGDEYGHEIYAINNEYVIFPEFYHVRKPPRGMHGYAFYGNYNPIFMINNKNLNIKPYAKIRFIDIMPTILKLLKLPIPSHVEGKSII